jgi:tape measure domain-containing protein
MSIKERVDLVGNVSAQARKWAADLKKLSAQARTLNRALSGGSSSSKPRDKQISAEARAERQKAAAIKSQARAAASLAREEQKAARVTGKSGARAEAQAAKQQAAAVKAQARASSQAAREQAQSAKVQARAAAATARAQQRAPVFGPGRNEAHASIMQRQRQQAAAMKAQTRAANDNAKALSRQEAAAVKAQAKSGAGGGGKAKGGGQSPGTTLRRTETGGIGGAVNSGIGNFAADSAMAGVDALVGMMRSLAGTFVEAQKFKEQSLAGLTILQKSGTEARKTWDESFKLARETGSTQREAMSSIQTMMATGFKKGEAVELYKLMNAISVINPKANLEGIVTAISQIKNTGKLQGDELLQLADAGVSVDAVYKALGKRLGKTREQIIAMQGAGEIKADDAIAAIKEAMTDSVGGKDGVDKALKGKAASLTSILARLQSAPETFFAGLEQDPALLDKMKGSLNSVVDLLDPSTEKGKKAAASFSKMVDAIAGPGADMFAQLAEGAPAFLTTVTQLGKDLAPLVSLMGQLASVTMWFFGGIGKLSGMLEGMDFSLLWGFMPQIIAWFGEVTGLFSTAGATMASNLISGLTGGIFGGSSSVVSSIVTMAQQAIAAGNAALQIASPSKVFAKMGEWIPEGLGRGIQDNMAVVERSSQAMAGGAVSSTQRSLPFVGDAFAASGAANGGKNISMGGIRQSNVFHLGSERDGVAQEIGAIQRQMVQREIQAFFNKSAAAA